MTSHIYRDNNKIAQSNLGTGSVELPTDYNGVPHIRPQNYPFPWTDPKTRLPASSLNPSDLHPKPHPYPISRFATMHWTERQTHGQTDGWRKYSMTKGRFRSTESDDAA